MLYPISRPLALMVQARSCNGREFDGGQEQEDGGEIKGAVLKGRLWTTSCAAERMDGTCDLGSLQSKKQFKLGKSYLNRMHVTYI